MILEYAVAKAVQSGADTLVYSRYSGPVPTVVPLVVLECTVAKAVQSKGNALV